MWNMFKVNNKNTNVILVSLLLALNIFHTFYLVFLFWTLNSSIIVGMGKTLLQLNVKANYGASSI